MDFDTIINRLRLIIRIVVGLLLVLCVQKTYAMEFDSSNPTQIIPGASVSLSINGGCPPYSWSLQGNGMNLANSSSVSPANTIAADPNSCGTATIQVADICGEKISTEIKNSVGGYYKLIESCGAIDGWHQTSCAEGDYRYLIDHFKCGTDGDHGDKCPDHPCCGCSSYYCAEGSQKYGWACEGDTKPNFTPKEVYLGNPKQQAPVSEAFCEKINLTSLS